LKNYISVSFCTKLKQTGDAEHSGVITVQSYVSVLGIATLCHIFPLGFESRLFLPKPAGDGVFQKLPADILGSTSEGASSVRKRRKMSASARAKIAAAQRARWAKQLGTKVPKAAPKPRRKVSAATRKRLAESAKARWAKARAAGKKTL
jgi:hypothetical protein